MDIKIACENDSEEWDKIVENSPHGTIFHTWKWLKLVEKHTKTKFYPLIALNGNTVFGIFPFFYKESFFNSLFSPPPHTGVPYLGPVIIDYEKMAQYNKESRSIEFQTKIDEFISSHIKPKYIYVAPTPFLIDSRPFKWAGYKTEERYCYSVDLCEGLDCVWERIKKETRQDIRRAERSGVSVEVGCKEELEVVYNLNVKRYEDQGLVETLNKDLLFGIYDSYPENIKIIVAKYKEDIVGGIIDIWYKDRVLSWVGNTKTNLKGVHVNDKINWECIKMAYENGFKIYETIGAASNQRLYKFSNKYNPNLSVYFTAKKYSSFISKFAEYSYINLLKPIYSKFKLRIK